MEHPCVQVFTSASSGCTYFVLTAWLGIHLCRWSQYGSAHSSIFPVSNWGYSQVWRLFKTHKEELMATALVTWRIDAKEPRVGEGWWPHVAHTSSARPGAGIAATSHAEWWPRDGLVLSRGFMALLFSKGIFLTRVLCCFSASYDKEIISIFVPFCLMFLTGVKYVAVLFTKRAKNTPNTWSCKLVDPTSRCLYKVFWWICCKSWKIKN